MSGSSLRSIGISRAHLLITRLTRLGGREAQKRRSSIDRVDYRLQKSAPFELVCGDLPYRGRGAGTSRSAGIRRLTGVRRAC